MPVAASDYKAIPEVLAEGNAGLLSRVNDHVHLAENILTLLDRKTNLEYSAAARAHIVSEFSTQVVSDKLADSYAAALAS